MEIIKSYDDFLLLENNTLNVEKLQDLVTNKLTCTIDYAGTSPNDVLRGIRIVEPYTVGVGEKGETYLRAWLIKGISRTGRINPRLVPGWRLFRVDRMRSINPSLQKFTIPKKGYSDKDSAMSEILFTATF